LTLRLLRNYIIYAHFFEAPINIQSFH
jgi:hypothetical protein